MEYKEITADIGKRLEFDNGTVVYMPEKSNEGYCYKDYEAFHKGKGVCYIREAEFDNECGLIVLNEEHVQDPPEDICNREQFVNACQSKVDMYKKDYGMSFLNEAEEEGFVQELAKYLMYVIEWAGIDMYLDDMDLIELQTAYQNNEL